MAGGVCERGAQVSAHVGMDLSEVVIEVAGGGGQRIRVGLD